jgi:hypothetical protein
MMKAQKGMATVDAQGQIILDTPLLVNQNSRVEVIILIPEQSESTELDLINDFRQAWHEAMTGQTVPADQLWDSLDHV